MLVARPLATEESCMSGCVMRGAPGSSARGPRIGLRAAQRAMNAPWKHRGRFAVERRERHSKPRDGNVLGRRGTGPA